MTEYSQDPYLSHYGVIGMKWGVRRYQNKDGSLTKAGKKHRQRVEQRAHEKKMREKRAKVKKERLEAAKNRSLLSDKELDSRINRLEKERRFRELTDSEVAPGRAKARKITRQVGDQLASKTIDKSTNAVVNGTGYLIKSGILGQTSSKLGLINEIFPYKKKK